MADAFPTRAEIEATQLAQLRQLLSAVLPANPFYTRKLGVAGITAGVDSLASFTRHCPFTTKPELTADQAAHPPYGTDLTFPLGRYSRLHQTSGTSGKPITWLDTPESWAWMVRNWKEVFRAAGVTAEDRVLFPFSFGPFIGFWMAFEAAAGMGCLCLPGGGLTSAARLRLILDHEVTALCCTPTYAIRLVEVAVEERIILARSKVKCLILAGEPGASIPAVRRRLEEFWPGARPFDHHGMTEVGAVSYECPKRPGVLHIMEDAYLAEVIHPIIGDPVKPGQIGELVLTTLGRTGSPLLRYRTGDLVRPSWPSPCECGRHFLALEGGILGRCDDMVVVRGVNVFPSAVEGIIRSCGGVAEYQVNVTQQGALTEMTLQVEPAGDCRSVRDLLRRLEKAFHDTLALRVPVKAVAPGALPRFESKARRWVRS